MRRIIVPGNVSLDGVMQAPALPDEDRPNGFRRGGWAAGHTDEVMVDVTTSGDDRGSCLLLGRRTYEGMAANWPHMPADNPFTQRINAMPRFVASTTLAGPLDWNATLLKGDLAEAVSACKAEDGPDLVVFGSGVLVRSLRAHDLVDEYLLSIYPLLLGSGTRLFPDGAPAALDIVESVTTTKGVVIARFRPVT